MDKKSNRKPIWIIVIVAIVASLAITAYAISRPDSASDNTVSVQPLDESNQNATSSQNDTGDTASNEDGSTVIIFKNDGFEPKTYSSSAGEAVTVRNDSSMDLEFSSDDHPTHRDNPELNMDVLGAGETGTFTPPGKGEYGFHDHINDQFTGTLTVN